MTEGESYCFDMGPIRPPSEGRDSSLLIRVTRNCAWNRCLFCNSYKGARFHYRGAGPVKADIDAAKAIADGLKGVSWALGYGGAVNDNVVATFIRRHPEVYGREAVTPEVQQARLQSLMNVARWLESGAATVFLQDADSPIMRTAELVEVLEHLRLSFPTVQRVTSYARSKTLARKTPEEMRALRAAGLSRLHVGLESGCDEVLRFMQKGVTAAEHVAAGRKVKEAGIELSEYVMPGLGGKGWTECHALESARVLNEIGADFIRLRSLIVKRDTPLHQRLNGGDYQPLDEDSVVDEIRLFLSNLECRSYLASDQMSNLLWEVEGQLPEDKTRLLEVIDAYRAMPQPERLRFRLRRRLRSYLSVYGALTRELDSKVEAALAAADARASDAGAKVTEAIAALKEGFV